MSQLHKRFSTDQVRDLLVRHLSHELKTNYLLEILGIGRRRFFELLAAFRKNPQGFSILTKRQSHHKLNPMIEKNILKDMV